MMTRSALTLPESYVVQKLYQHAGYPKYKKINNVYEAGCPMCMEGHSWGKKRRLYYIVKNHVICCHNCGWYSSPLKWIKHVAQMTSEEIEYELTTGEYQYVEIKVNDVTNTTPLSSISESLPRDSINMFDTQQLRYYKDNQIVKKCLNLIASRRLDTAINKPKALYVSLTDKIHKNRLCFPFYDTKGDITHYQTRAVENKDMQDRPKYLSKLNSQKTIFNFNNINTTSDNIYIFEGPIDSFFVNNGVAVAGIQESSQKSLTGAQQQMLATKPLMNKIWVLDNQWVDQASRLKTKNLIESGETVFIWPDNLKQFKDFNDMCMHYTLDAIEENFITKNMYTGLSASIKHSQIR